MAVRGIFERMSLKRGDKSVFGKGKLEKEGFALERG